jgi:hypothetical protein
MTSHVARPLRTSAYWAVFAAAAVVFVLDATATIHVVMLRPVVLEQNPIARWTLDLHPVAPYVLKMAVIAQCAATAALLRSMHERAAALAVIGLMAIVGLIGIASAVQALLAA